MLAPDAIVVSLQNGVRNPDTLRAHLGARPVVASIVSWNVVAVDGMWAGVLAPAGEHRIELRYEPGWVLPSLVIMLLGWVGVAALGWWPVGRRLR